MGTNLTLLALFTGRISGGYTTALSDYYCNDYETLTAETSVDTCMAKVPCESRCSGGEGLFTYRLSSQWCACCKNKDNALIDKTGPSTGADDNIY